MKEVRKFILGFLFLISLNLVSAYTKSSSYFGFSAFFSDFRSYIPFAIAFLVIFYAFNFVLNKSKMKNSWVIALILSIFSIYGLTISNIHFERIFLGIGFTEDFLFKFGPWILLALIALIVWIWGFEKVLLISGIILVVLAIIKKPEYLPLMLIISLVLIMIGVILQKKKKDKEEIDINITYTPENPPGGKDPKPPKVKKPKSRKKLLIREAKRFKRTSKKQKNPKFYNNWARFINKLKGRRYGRNEIEICRYFGVSRKEFLRIFNRYGKI